MTWISVWVRLVLNRHFSYVSCHNFKCQSYNIHKNDWRRNYSFPFSFLFLFSVAGKLEWIWKTGSVNWEKKHSLKTENYFLFSRFTEDPSQRYSLSDGPEGLFWRYKGGAKIQLFPKEKKKNYKTGSRTSKHYCWLKKAR